VATITVCDDLAFVTFYTDDRNDHLRAVVDDVSGTGGRAGHFFSYYPFRQSSHS